MRVHKKKQLAPGEQQREQRQTVRKGKSAWGKRTMYEGDRVTGHTCHRYVRREGRGGSQKPVKTTPTPVLQSTELSSSNKGTQVALWPSPLKPSMYFLEELPLLHLLH